MKEKDRDSNNRLYTVCPNVLPAVEPHFMVGTYAERCKTPLNLSSPGKILVNFIFILHPSVSINKEL